MTVAVSCWDRGSGLFQKSAFQEPVGTLLHDHTASWFQDQGISAAFLPRRDASWLLLLSVYIADGGAKSEVQDDRRTGSSWLLN